MQRRHWLARWTLSSVHRRGCRPGRTTTRSSGPCPAVTDATAYGSHLTACSADATTGYLPGRRDCPLERRDDLLARRNCLHSTGILLDTRSAQRDSAVQPATRSTFPFGHRLVTPRRLCRPFSAPAALPTLSRRSPGPARCGGVIGSRARRLLPRTAGAAAPGGRRHDVSADSSRRYRPFKDARSAQRASAVHSARALDAVLRPASSFPDVSADRSRRYRLFKDAR